MPPLGWNLALGHRITDVRITSDGLSPRLLLLAENTTRVLTFTLPLLLPLQVKNVGSQVGLAVYTLGTLVYFVSWHPLMFAPGSPWSDNPFGLLAPRLTPFLSFLGIALIGNAMPYDVLSALFIFFHTWHGNQNIGD